MKRNLLRKKINCALIKLKMRSKYVKLEKKGNIHQREKKINHKRLLWKKSSNLGNIEKKKYLELHNLEIFNYENRIFV